MRYWLAFLFMSCGAKEAPCVEFESSCQPLYTPTFDNIYDFTIEPGCGLEGTSCHSTEANHGGFDFTDREQTFSQLKEVVGDGPDCSILARRAASPDPTFSMPPKEPLVASERCAIQMWINAGAPRN